MSLSALLSHWRADPSIAENIVEWHTLPARTARFAAFPADLHPALVQALQAQGIRQLFLHQSDSWEKIRSGQNTVIVTGTASGKTLCYNLPILDSLICNPQARALYLFPTKALSQDQYSVISKQLSTIQDQSSLDISSSITYSIYDGDTPASARPGIRNKARLVITNPDMLHTGILPHHTSWIEFFRNLEFVVIDEMHTYRGVFGSHIANLLRRLKRIARHYGAAARFILTSATIANPVQLAEWLVEEPVTMIGEDGSARGAKHFLLYNPPLIDRSLGLRRSVLQECVRLAEDLLAYQVQTIIFGRARRTVEVILAYLKEKEAGNIDEIGEKEIRPIQEGISSVSSNQPSKVRGYRSGYLPRQRREIEHGLRSGAVQAVVATNALELGIDIGGMGASLLVGYPGTIAATWQQAGRAGRGTAESLAILLASANPLDQFLANHPDYFFGRSPEQALVNPDNLLILLGHLRCAAFELPFQEGERFGNIEASRVQEFLDFLLSEGILHHSGKKYFWMADRYPAEGVSLRSTSADVVVLQVQNDISATAIGQVDIPSAAWLVHPGAVYLHEAQTYFIESLDLEQHIAQLKPALTDYYTEPRSETSVSLIEKLGEDEARGGTKSHGEVTVTTQVIGYRKIRWHTHETLGFGELSLPPSELQTTGYWLTLAEETVDALREQGLWTNSPNDYGPSWPRLRDQVRARDGYRCQVCGAAEFGRAHDVHHKIPFRSLVSPEVANQLTNLITLCPSCHRRVETAVRIRSGLAGLAFVLLNLAPLFLMCDPRDLGVHSDFQLTLSEGKPGLLIYDRVPAGIGFSERLYEIHYDLMENAYDLISTCGCVDGCPSCVGPGGENGSGGKRETLAMLKILAGK